MAFEILKEFYLLLYYKIQNYIKYICLSIAVMKFFQGLLNSISIYDMPSY